MALKAVRIVIDRETIMVVGRAGTDLVWCPGCCAEVEVIVLASESLAKLFAACTTTECMSAENLHLSHEPNGAVRVCLPSLLRCFEQ